MLPFNILSMIVFMTLFWFNAATSSMVNSTNYTSITEDSHHQRKPITMPLVSPNRTPNVPTTKPLYKYPTKKPSSLKPPNVKPVYNIQLLYLL